ncbi:MAG: hypothetical protein IPM07_21235 [Anaerolineales bacterium]|nr:hypothetical protein [Anaerolineales bacterium]
MQEERRLAREAEHKSYERTLCFGHQQPIRPEIRVEQDARAQRGRVDRVVHQRPIPQANQCRFVGAAISTDDDAHGAS